MERSEIRDAEEGPEAGVFRVRVSLERYFSDERARCYMAVSGARPVRALARRLRRAFRLPRPFALLSRGHLLPPDEPLALLRPDDPVQVIPTRFETNEAGGRPTPEDTPPRSPDTAPRAVAVDSTDGADGPEPAAPGADPAAAGERLGAAPEPDLEEHKRRALQLLDECEAPARRRRRVRRRRARAAPAASPAAEREAPAPEREAPAREAPAAEREAPAREAPDPEPERRSPAPAAVVRNGAASPRAARVVRPLRAASPPPAALS